MVGHELIDRPEALRPYRGLDGEEAFDEIRRPRGELLPFGRLVGARLRPKNDGVVVDRERALAQPEYGSFRGTCWAEGEVLPEAAGPATLEGPASSTSSRENSQPADRSFEGRRYPEEEAAR